MTARAIFIPHDAWSEKSDPQDTAELRSFMKGFPGYNLLCFENEAYVNQGGKKVASGRTGTWLVWEGNAFSFQYLIRGHANP